MQFIYRLIATVLAFANTLLGTLGIIDNPQVPKSEKFRVTSYIIGGTVQDKANLHSEDFDIITDVIIIDSATFNEKGEIVTEKEELETALKNIREVIGGRDVKIHINLFGPERPNIYDDPDKNLREMGKLHTKAFNSGVMEENVANFVKEYNFDGVFFDYESPVQITNWMPFNHFLVRLNNLIPDKVIGLALAHWDIKMSVGSIMAVDRIEAMLYDNIDENGYHSAYENSVKCAKRFELAGIPRHKIDFGVPFYGRPVGDKAWDYGCGYSGFYGKINKDGYCDAFGCTFWFNTPEVIQQKTQYALDNRYGGMMIWHYTCDLPSSHPDSLMRAMNETIVNYNK